MEFRREPSDRHAAARLSCHVQVPTLAYSITIMIIIVLHVSINNPNAISTLLSCHQLVA